MDEDAEMACLFQLQQEQERYEYEQKLLKDDPFFEQWLNSQERTVYEVSSESRR